MTERKPDLQDGHKEQIGQGDVEDDRYHMDRYRVQVEIGLDTCQDGGLNGSVETMASPLTQKLAHDIGARNFLKKVEVIRVVWNIDSGVVEEKPKSKKSNEPHSGMFSLTEVQR